MSNVRPDPFVFSFVFSIATDPRTGVVRRHHAHEQALQRAIKKAVLAANIARFQRVSKGPGSHSFSRMAFNVTMAPLIFALRRQVVVTVD